MPNRSLLLQAEDADTRDQWVATMNKAIGFYLNEGQRKSSLPKSETESITSKTKSKPSVQIQQKIQTIDGNAKCADCGCGEQGSGKKGTDLV